MGQRSQIYIKFETVDDKRFLVANYYQWNYGERMISRAKHIIEFIKDIYESFGYKTSGNFHYWYGDKNNLKKISRIADTNFDMGDIAHSINIIEEYIDFAKDDGESFANYVFYGQDNNDGQLYIYVQRDGTIKYVMTDYNGVEIKDCREYVKDYHVDDPLTNEENLTYIEENAKLMTNSEWAAFINDDYSSLYKNYSNDIQRKEFRLSLMWSRYLKSSKKYKDIKISDLLSEISEDKAAWLIRRWATYFNEHWTRIPEYKDDADKYFLSKVREYIDDYVFEQ